MQALVKKKVGSPTEPFQIYFQTFHPGGIRFRDVFQRQVENDSGTIQRHFMTNETKCLSGQISC